MPVGTKAMALWKRVVHVPLEETKAAQIASIVLSLISMGVLSVCLSRRVQNVKNWKRLPVVCWLVLVIYMDSIAFVASTAILSNGFGVSYSISMCSRAILLCLSCYMTTKLLYYFLVERVYIIRRSSKPRRKDPLYLFNSLGMLIPYFVVIVLNYYFRFAIYENGKCLIGMKRVAMIPLLAFDVLVNVYLTSLFLLPLRETWSYKNARNSGIRAVALRTFIGSCGTLVSSIVNVTFILVVNGEPGWLCLMCCNIDILFSVLVLHWITTKDNASTTPASYIQAKPQSSPGQSANRCMVPQNDIEIYRFRFKEQRRDTEVMTMVSATRENEDINRITCPPNVITVERSHTREVFDAEEGKSQKCGNDELRNMNMDFTDGSFPKR